MKNPVLPVRKGGGGDLNEHWKNREAFIRTRTVEKKTQWVQTFRERVNLSKVGSRRGKMSKWKRGGGNSLGQGRKQGEVEKREGTVVRNWLNNEQDKKREKGPKDRAGARVGFWAKQRLERVMVQLKKGGGGERGC